MSMWDAMIDTNNSSYIVMSSLRDGAVGGCHELRNSLIAKGYAILASGTELWLGKLGGIYSPEKVKTVLRYEEVIFKQHADMHRLIVKRTLTELDRLDLEQI